MNSIKSILYLFLLVLLMGSPTLTNAQNLNCDSFEAIAIPNPEAPDCCFSIQVYNDSPNTFSDVRITPLTPMNFDDVVYTTGWTANTSTGSLLHLVHSSGFIPVGTSEPVSICITDYNTIPQQILVELITPDGEVCERSVYMDCEISNNFCPGNLVQNGDFEIGVASSGDQDIASATGWGGIWTGGSLADLYNTTTTTIPGVLTMPQPASQSNFAGFWCRNISDPVWREGIMNTLNNTILPNSGCYDVTLKIACMYDVTGIPALSLFGVPVGATGVSNPGGNTPTNDNLFTPQAVELHIEPIPSSCDENFQTYTFTIDSGLIPAGGIDRIFLTRTDGASGTTFLAVDDVCIVPGNCCDQVDWSTLNYGIVQDSIQDCVVKVFPVGNGAIPPLVYDWYDVDVDDDGSIEFPGVGSTDTTCVYTYGGWIHIKVTAYKIIAGDTCSHEYILDLEMPPCDPVCENNLAQNGNFEMGIANSADQDIANATGWSGIWTGGSLGDFYNTTTTTIPWALTMPQPASQGNFAGFWCRNHPDEVWREGIMNSLKTTIMPNTGCYDVTLKIACMHEVTGIPQMSLYGVPVGATGVSNPGGNSPSNDNLFAPQAVELHIETIPSDCDENFQTYTFTIDSGLIPAGGIDRVFLTRTDGISGSTFLAVDDVCIAPGNCCDQVDWSTLTYGIMQDTSEDCLIKVFPIGNGVIPPLVYDWYDVDVDGDSSIEFPGVGSTDTTYVNTLGGWIYIKVTAYKVIAGDTCSHEYFLELEIPPCDPVCENNLVQNGDFEIGTATPGDQDIANAMGWGGIWTGGSTGDLYNTVTTGISGALTMPQPVSQSNFAGFWCRNHSDEVWREGIMNTLNGTILPNTGCYDVTFKMACLYNVSGSPELSIFGVPVGATGLSSPGGATPTNANLFAQPAVELGKILIDASCDENFFTVTFQFNSNVLPAVGIDWVFFTRTDNAVGTTYLGVDDVCIAPGECDPISAVRDVIETPLLFTVQPTVATDVVSVILEDVSDLEYEMQVFDISGRPVMNRIDLTRTVTELSVAELPAGMYLVSVRAEDGSTGVQRIIKQ